MTTPRILAAVFFAGLALAPALRAAEAIDLSGKWRFQLDREDAGGAARWFDLVLAGSASLPGSLQSQGIGDPVTVGTKWTGGIVDRSYFSAPEYAPYRVPGNIKVPFWLQPETTYV